MKRATCYIAGCLAALCMMLCQGCDGGYDCALDNIAYNRIKFYGIDENGTETAYTFPDALTVSMMVNGRDSIVVNHITNAKELTLPMSYTSNCDTVILKFLDRYNDTLYIYHSNTPIYQSMECGVIMHHTITGSSHTTNFIDSLAINTANVNFDHNENIKLYITE